MQKIKFVWLVLCLLTVSCGYHLRGVSDLPEALQVVYLHGASPELKKVLRATFSISGGRMESNVLKANVIINVTKEELVRRVISLSTTGRANEYELDYELEFTLFDIGGNPLSELLKVKVSAEYFNDQEDVLGKENEEQVIRDELYQQAVQSIIDRSAAVLEKKVK